MIQKLRVGYTHNVRTPWDRPPPLGLAETYALCVLFSGKTPTGEPPSVETLPRIMHVHDRDVGETDCEAASVV